MPKKACCCGGNWIAVSCRYWGGNGFVGYHYTGATGFTGSDTSTQLNSFISELKNHPVYGISGYYKWTHPYWEFPDGGLALGSYGAPPLKLKGISCGEQQSGGGLFGGGFGNGGGFNSGSDCNPFAQKCFELVLDTDRQIIYKAWGAGGGGVNTVIPGGNGAYAQKTGTYNKDYIAVVGYGGIGYEPGKSFTGWTAAIDTVPAGGGQGYGAWGGGAAYIATSISEPESAFIIAGGGGGAGKYSAKGGDAGDTFGGMGGGIEGGCGGSQSAGGKGGTGAQDGQGSKGGRGAFNVTDGGGGGGGGKKGGGGGGLSGYGGGGGSSTVTKYSQSATANGPANMCDPDYWVADVAGIGGYKEIAGSGGWIPTNTKSDGTGLSGKITLSFASMRCPCDESLSTIPEKTYLCLTNAQAEYICNMTQECCASSTQGTTGASGASGGSGGTGSTGSTGYNPCSGLANYNTVIERRGSTAGTTGGTASVQNIGLGGGYGGGGLGAFVCPNSNFGLSGSSGGAGLSGFQEMSRTGEIQEILYKTFRYDGELYYLLFQCGAMCDEDHKIPDDADITDIACRPWASCCRGLYAFPLCKITDTKPVQSCWPIEYCPCNKTDCPSLPFYVCDDVDSYPDIFWTLKDGWYYTVAKTDLWEPFGDSIQTRGTIGEILLKNPCIDCPTNGSGTTECEGNSGGNSGGIGSNNSGDTEPKNCCIEVSEEWNGVSPFNANINFSIEYAGQAPFLSDCTAVQDCNCSYDFRQTPFTDSSSFTAKLSYSNDFLYIDDQIVGGNCRTPQCPPLPGTDVPNTYRRCMYALGPGKFFFNDGVPVSGPYNTNLGSASYGSGLGQKCYGLQTECGIKFNTGTPTLESDLNQPNVLRDAAYKIITECVIYDPECTAGTGSPYPVIPYADGPCDGIPPGPLDTGPLVKANGCRLSTYIAALQAASEGKYTVIDLGAPDTYWIGGWRDIIQGIPGDQVDPGDPIVTDIPSGDKLIRRIEYTVYVYSPAYSVYVYIESKNLTNCCDGHINMTWGHSECGRKTPYGYECIPNPGTCPDFNNSYVVSNYKTLQQWEANPQTQMFNPKCWIGFDTIAFTCPQMWDDFDGLQICNVTLT